MIPLRKMANLKTKFVFVDIAHGEEPREEPHR